MDLASVRVVVIHDDANRAAELERWLTEAGYRQIVLAALSGDPVKLIRLTSPDAVIIDLAETERAALKRAFSLSKQVSLPVAMFVDRGDSAAIAEAIEAGISAFVIDGRRADRVRQVLETAVSRFASFERLRRERDEATARLAERKTIERAKGLLMAHRGLDEAQAYTLLRRAAMQHRRKVVDIAHSVITAYQLDF